MTLSLVSVIVPARDEAPTLEELVERTERVFRDHGQRFEFILVDDGSRDDTPLVTERLRRRHPNVTVIRHYRNQGKSIALMQGFEIASGDVAVTMDADLQDKPEMIPRLLAKLEEGYDCVNGRRLDRKDGFARRLVSRLFNWFVSRVFDCDLEDVNCGLRAMRREVYRAIELHGDLHRLIPVLVRLQAFKIAEVPVEHDERRAGKSHYRLLRHRGVLDVVALLAINTTQVRPFHFFCELAFAFLLLAFLSFVGWAVTAGHIAEGEPGWRVLAMVFGALSVWSAFVGTILPLFGFFLEVEARRFQDRAWRQRLVKEILRSEGALDAARSPAHAGAEAEAIGS